jgi:hypothetical protein
MMSDRAPEELVQISSQRLDRSEQRLLRNLSLQLFVIGISIYSYVRGNEPLTDISIKYLGSGVEEKAIQLFLLISLIYLFTRFGFLVSTFVHMRLICSSFLEKYSNVFEKEEFRLVARIFDTDSLVEPIIQKHTRDKDGSRRYWAFLTIMVTIILTIMTSLNNICILLYMEIFIKGTYYNLSCITVTVFIGFFFYMFSRSRLAILEPWVKVAAVASPILTLGIFGALQVFVLP